MAESHKRQKSEGNYHVSSEFVDLMVHTKVESLHPSSGIVYVAKREDYIVDVWKGLTKYSFSSVPVLQKTKNKWYGFVDLADVTHAVVEIFGKHRLDTDQDFWATLAEDEMFQKKKVSDVMMYPLTRRNPFHPVAKGYSLFSAIEIMAREQGVHRIPVIENFTTRKLLNIVTQSQIVDWLASNVDKLGTFKNKPIDLMASAHHQVIKVFEDETSMEAFKLMHYMNVSGLAVINNEGKLVGSISLSDLKLIHADGKMFHRLFQPVKTFLGKAAADATPRPRHPLIVEPNETIESALKKLQKHKVHRLFVVDKDHKPVGIVALRDILLELVSA